jgi:poly(A)-specific ribonuclease
VFQREAFDLLTRPAISFLAKNGFQFDLPITQGVRYLSRAEEQVARQNMSQEQGRLSNLADMDIKAEDAALVNHIKSSIKDWLAEPEKKREESLNIPNLPSSGAKSSGVPSTLNRRQIRLTHQIARNEFEGLQTTGMGHFVRITAPSAEQKAAAELSKAYEREQTIANAIGFRWLIEGLMGGNIGGVSQDLIVAGTPGVDMGEQNPKKFIESLQQKLRTRTRVLVGHNCFTDLVNFYKCFIGSLPDTVEAFADEIHSLFPAVIDTKHMASFGSKRWGDTSLQGVEYELRSETEPKVHVPAEFDRYEHEDRLHEAGYDSMLTALIAIRLSAKMEKEGKYLADQHMVARYDFGMDDEEYASADESSRRSPVEAIKNVISTATSSMTRLNIAAPTTPEIDTKIEKQIKEGQLMPRWRGHPGYWNMFGNTLQVNGSKEGTCRLG